MTRHEWTYIAWMLSIAACSLLGAYKVAFT